VHDLGKFFQFIYQAAGFIGLDALGDRGLTQRGAQLGSGLLSKISLRSG
jgi:hypothetical protein